MAAPKRVTKRRGETRQRMLEAALRVFADQGFGRSTVEQVCERAGYTRGAFYSNFASLDDLFLAMWEQRSTELIDGLKQALEEMDTSRVKDVRGVVELVTPAVPVDDTWFRITAEFTAHALRNPGLRRVMTAREEAISSAITPVIAELLANIGRETPDQVALGQAVVAVHDGTAAQCLLEPDNPVVWRRRADLFERVLTAYSIETGGRS
ncbi:TetR/AcrR family transcriptional regulator [Kutzneria sp. CA-103260]|uniref:TetR/AcrR family transcriptional regulator n=1 Tax=Kutzneria sp. CA-103260 TaxID=2802641 RepID=UPI001BEE7A95|nr:TetR/AcrR family transcriptional regulator [Kutzneria sp. CA-103260]QUQ66827.1 TetR family transcriptional regulator [Kutzneria sp. CA-103260]